MRAAFMPAPGAITVGDFPVPDVGAGQVLVRMRYASICGSDVHLVYGGFHHPAQLGAPGYPGHEGIGTVVSSRSPRFPVGCAVLTVPPATHFGCFAEFQAVDETHLVPVPHDGDLAALLLAQQLGTTVFGLKKFIDGAPPRTAAVIGAGSAGLFFLQQLRRMGTECVIVSDLNPGRLSVADELGATTTVDATRSSIAAAAHDLTAGEGVDLVIEAAGPDECRVEAVEAARNRGTVGFFGYPERVGTSPFPVERAFRKSLRMEWINKTQEEPGLTSFRRAVELIHRGGITVAHCLQHTFALDDIEAAFESARRQGDGFPKVGLVL